MASRIAEGLNLVFSGLLLLSGCGSSTEAGSEVRIVSAPTALSSGETLESVPGQSLSVSEVQWASVSVELVLCPSAGRWVSEALVGTAHAHGVSSPTRLAVPMIEWATSVDDVLLGVLRPSAERYCEVRYTVGAADADAVGIAEAPEMVHHSLLAHGFDTATATPTEFRISGELAFEVVEPVVLDVSHGEHVTVRIERDEARWFEGLDLTSMTPTDRARRLADNLRASISIHADPG